jgi:hypothetical protein
MEAADHKPNQNYLLSELSVMLHQKNLPGPVDIKRIKNSISADYRVSKEEADLLFSLKDAVPEIIHTEGFDELFVNGIISFLLYTGETKGSLDNLEYIWLKDHFTADHAYDYLEKKLLTKLIDRAEEVPANLHTLVKKF